jgi:hypothetical protein
MYGTIEERESCSFHESGTCAYPRFYNTHLDQKPCADFPLCDRWAQTSPARSGYDNSKAYHAMRRVEHESTLG